MKKTDWIEYEEDGHRYRVHAEYGMQKLGDQEPYFSITGETQRVERGRWSEDSFGMLHPVLEQHMPKLEPLLKWHGVFQKEGPMHYVANGLWWWDHYVGSRVVDKYQMMNNPGKSSSELGLECFKSTVVFGGAGPEDLPPISASLNEVKDWLLTRLPKLMDAFRRDMAAAGVVDL